MDNFNAQKGELIKFVEQLDEENVLRLANELLHEGIDPLDLLDVVNDGMNRVGRLYEKKDYYIADLIMAGLIFKQILELELMTGHFHKIYSRKIGKILLGTVNGDIHDIGKDITRGMLEAGGFEVIDLGVDVPKELFVSKVKEYQPDILGLSGVLTTTAEEMKKVVEALTVAGLRDKVKIIVGANYLDENSSRYIGADAFANEASAGVKWCRKWITDSYGRGAADHD